MKAYDLGNSQHEKKRPVSSRNTNVSQYFVLAFRWPDDKCIANLTFFSDINSVFGIFFVISIFSLKNIKQFVKNNLILLNLKNVYCSRSTHFLQPYPNPTVNVNLTYVSNVKYLLGTLFEFTAFTLKLVINLANIYLFKVINRNPKKKWYIVEVTNKNAIILFVQFKKHEKHPGRSVTLGKVAGSSLQLY